MHPIYLSAIAHVHGEPRPVSELGEEMPVDLTFPAHGLRDYRESDLEIWELATAAIEQTVARSPTEPDLLLCATENDRTTTESLGRITRRIGLPKLEYLAIAAHACANLGPGLALARDALQLGGRQGVLLAMADRALDHARLLTTGLSVFSDGAASGMITADRVDVDGPQFAIHGIATKVDALSDPIDSSKIVRSTVEIGKSAIESLLDQTGRKRDDYEHVLFANYRISSQKFLTAAMGFPENKLLLGPIAEFGHSFSADILVNLERLTETGTIRRGDHLVVSATGPYTWSMFDVEYV